MNKVVSKPKTLCDIVIPVWNQLEATDECLEHIVKNTKHPYRLIIVDNGSEYKTRHFLEGFKERYPDQVALIVNGSNEGFIKAVNRGMRTSSAPYVCVLNNDTVPGEGWLTELVRFAESHESIGLLNPLCSGHIANKMTINKYAKFVSKHADKYMEMNQCQGFCMLIKRDLINVIGYLDERFGIGGFDDTDYSMRAHKADYRSICVHSSYVYHKEHTSFDVMGYRKDIQKSSEKEYFKKWPRHLRIVLIFSLSEDTSEEEIVHQLKSSLYLAREWCWVNLWIFGDNNAKERVDRAKERIAFPIHQNIKYNYLRDKLKIAEVGLRVIERSFGSKRRKKYDAIICDDKKLISLLRFFGKFQDCVVSLADFRRYPENILKNTISFFRKDEEGNENMRCDIILPICDQYEFTKSCVESIIKHTDTPYRLIVINNGKDPDTKVFLDELETNNSVDTIVVHNKRNIGWVKALNKGLELSDAPYVCFQNNDTIVTKNWLRKLIGILKSQGNFGLINPTWEGRPKGISIDRYNEIVEGKGKKRFVETDFCRGFSVVVKRDVIDTIGKMDEIYGLAYFDDVDYSVNATESGFLCLKALDTYIEHHRNITASKILRGSRWNELHEKNKLICYRKWGRPLRLFLILNSTLIKTGMNYESIVDMLYYLVRRQHKVYILSSHRRLCKGISHTNIKITYCPDIILWIRAVMKLYFNSQRKTDKRYDAVFINDTELAKGFSQRFRGRQQVLNSDNAVFDIFVKQKADDLKEKTKESINVQV